MALAGGGPGLLARRRHLLRGGRDLLDGGAQVRDLGRDGAHVVRLLRGLCEDLLRAPRDLAGRLEELQQAVHDVLVLVVEVLDEVVLEVRCDGFVLVQGVRGVVECVGGVRSGPCRRVDAAIGSRLVVTRR